MSEMIFYFKALGDELKLTEVKNKTYTGNVNSYICEFDLSDDWDGLSAFAVFSCGDDVYTVLLSEDGQCTIPSEILADVGVYSVGLFATNASENKLKRISTGFLQLSVDKGAYAKENAPSVPTPDAWEVLMSKMTPKIGENGNWYVWDSEKNTYSDSKKPARGEKGDKGDKGEKGDKPQRGVDYMNGTDIEALRLECTDNKVTALTENSTNEEYPSAKAVFDKIAENLPKRRIESDSAEISGIDDSIAGSELINLQVWGKSIQQAQPTRDNPCELLNVGDLCSDGRYKVSINLGGTNYDVYLQSPLRGIVGYGYNNETKSYEYKYSLDYIDFKKGKVIRKIKEIPVNINSLSLENGVGKNITPPTQANNNKYWYRYTDRYTDMDNTILSNGVSVTTGLMSNYLQRYNKKANVSGNSEGYIYAAYGYNIIYYYFSLEDIGLRVEEATEDDYLLANAAKTAYYNVYNGSDQKLTTVNEIKSAINEFYSGKNIKVYYPLAEPQEESVTLPKLITPSGASELDVGITTKNKPQKIAVEYYADVSKVLEKAQAKIEELTNALLAQGGNV